MLHCEPLESRRLLSATIAHHLITANHDRRPPIQYGTTAQLTGSFAGRTPLVVKQGARGVVTIAIHNSGRLPVAPPYLVAVAVGQINEDGSLGDQTPLAHAYITHRIGRGGTRVTVRFHYTVDPGFYKIIIAGGPVSNQWDWITVASAQTIVDTPF